MNSKDLLDITKITNSPSISGGGYVISAEQLNPDIEGSLRSDINNKLDKTGIAEYANNLKPRIIANITYDNPDYFKVCEFNINQYYGRFSLIACIDHVYSNYLQPSSLIFKINACQKERLDSGVPPEFSLYSLCRCNYPLSDLVAICTEVKSQYSKIELYTKTQVNHKVYTLTPISYFHDYVESDIAYNTHCTTLPTGLKTVTLKDSIVT